MSPVRRGFSGYIFDLDGTLVDSFGAIAASVNEVRAHHGVAPLSVDEVRAKVGHGLEYLLDKTVPGLDLREDPELYREHHARTFLAGTRLLPGAATALAALAQRGAKLALASNKPRLFSERILAHFAVRELFDLILGPESVPCRKPAPDMLEMAIARWKLPRESVLYVGDMSIDVETARGAGLKVCILDSGTQSRDVLEAARPDYIIERLDDLPAIV